MEIETSNQPDEPHDTTLDKNVDGSHNQSEI
jgi:hypothetical protein